MAWPDGRSPMSAAFDGPYGIDGRTGCPEIGRRGYPDGVLFRAWEYRAGPPPVRTVTDRLGRPYALVSGYAEVKSVLADPDTYRPDNALDAVTPIPVPALRVLTRYGFRLPPTLANNGGASHPTIRAITARALHPDRVAAQRPWLEALVAHRVARLDERLAKGGQVDLYADLVADLPLLVLARLVELPDSDAVVVKEFSRAALELFWAPLSPARQAYLAEVVGRYHAVLRDFAATAGGLVGELRSHAHGAGLAPDVPVAALFFLLVAGQETTSQFLTLLLHRLAGEPAVHSGLSTKDIRVEDVVEEGLRLVPPIVTWRRVAARDTTLGGVAVPRGVPNTAWRSAQRASLAGTRRSWRGPTTSLRASPDPGGTWPSARARTGAWARTWPGWRPPWWSRRARRCCTGSRWYARRGARTTCRSGCRTRSWSGGLGPPGRRTGDTFPAKLRRIGSPVQRRAEPAGCLRPELVRVKGSGALRQHPGQLTRYVGQVAPVHQLGGTGPRAEHDEPVDPPMCQGFQRQGGVVEGTQAGAGHHDDRRAQRDGEVGQRPATLPDRYEQPARPLDEHHVVPVLGHPYRLDDVTDRQRYRPGLLRGGQW